MTTKTFTKKKLLNNNIVCKDQDIFITGVDTKWIKVKLKFTCISLEFRKVSQS